MNLTRRFRFGMRKFQCRPPCTARSWCISASALAQEGRWQGFPHEHCAARGVGVGRFNVDMTVQGRNITRPLQNLHDSLPYCRCCAMLMFCVVRKSGEPYATATIGISEKSMELRLFYLPKHSNRITDTKRTRSASNAKAGWRLNSFTWNRIIAWREITWKVYPVTAQSIDGPLPPGIWNNGCLPFFGFSFHGENCEFRKFFEGKILITWFFNFGAIVDQVKFEPKISKFLTVV